MAAAIAARILDSSVVCTSVADLSCNTIITGFACITGFAWITGFACLAIAALTCRFGRPTAQLELS